MQDDLFADPRLHEGRQVLVSAGREYRSLETKNGIGVAWFGPGDTQGVIGCYFASNADALAAAHTIEQRRKNP